MSVKGINQTPQSTNWRQPCSTCYKLLNFFLIFLKLSFQIFIMHFLVRFDVLYRIEPHVPLFENNLCQFLWVSTLRSYSPGGKLNALATALLCAALSFHRLQPGLQGYLILFTPLAFVSQCQLWSSRAPSPLVFLLISTHFTAPWGIPSTSPTL